MDTNHVKPEKFLQSYRCECFQPHNYCNCPHKIIGSESYVESVKHAAKAIAEVMVICSIPEHIAQNSIDIVIYYFLHFQEKRHRIDTVPRKRIYRLDLMNDLACKCGMTFTQAQMSYSIIKRVFRAFYHGTDEGGVPNPLLEVQLKHSSACLWYHAARRTAQVVASYLGMFTVVQKNIELEIRQIYRKLYDHITKIKPVSDVDHECTCLKCYKRIIVETLQNARGISELNPEQDKHTTLYQRESKRIEESKGRGSQSSQRKQKRKSSIIPVKCKCRSLRKHKDECDIPLLAESTNTGYSQGPFTCSWYPITEESDKEDDIEIDVLQQLPIEIPCPPCDEEQSDDDSPCSSCSSCTCESCTCTSERSCDADTDTLSIAEAVEEEYELTKQTSDLEVNETTTQHKCCPYSTDEVYESNSKESKYHRVQKHKGRRLVDKKKRDALSVSSQSYRYSSIHMPRKKKSLARSTISAASITQSKNITNAYAVQQNISKESKPIKQKHRETMTEFFNDPQETNQDINSIINDIIS